jgi:hypothetical protein
MPDKVTVYDKEYFTSSQTSLYIGDVLIDEITGLQVSVTQNKRPIYGYASQLFDKVAKGTVLVQGSFTINFKESGYLVTVLERHKKLTSGFNFTNLSPFLSSSSFSKGIPGKGATSDNDKGVLGRRNIEQLEEGKRLVDSVVEGKINGQPISNEQFTQFLVDLSGFRGTGQEGELPPVESVFEDFENRVWGNDNSDAVFNDRRADSNRFDGFTIFISWGDFNSNDRINHTAKRIDNVRIVNQSQVIGMDGQPIQETYEFIARNFT